MNEFEIRDKLISEREEIKSFEDLVAFLKEVREYNSDYGGAPRAIAQAALATAQWFADDFGITGFQACCVMWDFIYGLLYTNNECGLKIVDYDDMLYPQYEHKFEKTISPEIWSNIQKQADKKLKDNTKHVHPAVIAHWKSIVNGIVPFGYSVKED